MYFNIVNRVTQETDLLVYVSGSSQVKTGQSVTGHELLGHYLTRNKEINSLFIFIY